ncbi:MAG: hypothetical protein LUG16_08030 [Candidatus Gastranaerophilales bacterium]|nr:hypothetical protein [Candidatus Gastranaerophilales bacterium]
MGKSKKRIFNKNTSTKGVSFRRQEIILQIYKDIKASNINEETQKFITLFGITPEELLEAGVSFEELHAVKHIFL